MKLFLLTFILILAFTSTASAKTSFLESLGQDIPACINDLQQGAQIAYEAYTDIVEEQYQNLISLVPQVQALYPQIIEDCSPEQLLKALL